MSTTIIPESPSPQLKIALSLIYALRESKYEISDLLADDFFHITGPSSTGMWHEIDKDEYLENMLQYREMFSDDVVETVEEIVECPGKVFIYAMFDGLSSTGRPINFDITYTFHFKLDEEGVQISSLRVFLDSQIMDDFFSDEAERKAALEAEAEADED